MSDFLKNISFASFFENPTADTNDYAEDLKSFSLDNNELSNPQQINFFIGENNSGKSRFIRTLMKWFKYDKQERYEFRLTLDNLLRNEILTLIELTNNKSFAKSMLTPLLNDIKTCFDLHSINGKPLSLANEKMQKTLQRISDDAYLSTVKSINYYSINPSMGNAETIIRSLQNKLNIFKTQLNDAIKSISSQIKPVNILYLPLLRGAKLLGENLKEDFYLKRTINDYGFEESEVFTGLSIYKDLQNSFLGSAKDKKLIAEFENLLSKYFFEGKTVSITANKEKDWVGLRIGEEEERPLHKLGDGVQALIVLLFPLYMRKEEDYFIFIEEPEMHLYPKWQRLFIKILQEATELQNGKEQKIFAKHQFFMTTHSNVFINMEGSSVYQVTRDHNENKSIVKYALDDEKRKILSDLSYQASDMLRANFIIWVEGPSDRIYINHFLKLLNSISEEESKFVEHIHYCFMLYGGETLSHFSVEDAKDKIHLSKINPHFWIIADSDYKAEKGYSLSVQKKPLEGLENASITKYREIENHIPMDIWKEAYNNAQHGKEENFFTITELEQPYCEQYGDRFKREKPDKEFPNRSYVSKGHTNKVPAANSVIKLFTKEHFDEFLLAEMKKLSQAIQAANEKH